MTSAYMTLQDFLSLTKVLRMLYGVDVAKHFFTTNLEIFTGISVEALRKLIKSATIDSPRDSKKKEV